MSHWRRRVHRDWGFDTGAGVDFLDYGKRTKRKNLPRDRRTAALALAKAGMRPARVYPRPGAELLIVLHNASALNCSREQCSTENF